MKAHSMAVSITNIRTDETEPAPLAEAAKELARIPVDVIAAVFTPAIGPTQISKWYIGVNNLA
jgi:hypothetical protein